MKLNRSDPPHGPDRHNVEGGRPVPPKNPSGDDKPTSSTPGTPRRTRATAKDAAAKNKAAEPKKPAATRKPATRKATAKPAPAGKATKATKATDKTTGQDQPSVGVIRANPLHLGDEAYTFTDPEDQKRVTKSVYVPRGTVERARAAVAFLKHYEYMHPELEGQIPTSLAALFDNAVNRLVDEIEERYNDSKPLRRVYKLQVGPSRSGATRGAASRAAARRDTDNAG